MKNIAVLCSGIGLGFYIPGLILKHQLEQKGNDVSFYVFEDLLRDEKQRLIPGIRKIFADNFRIARVSQKTLGSNAQNINEVKKQQFYQELVDKRVQHLICFTGFWQPVLLKYLEEHGEVQADWCHVDVVASTSWKAYEIHPQNGRDVYFQNYEQKAVHYRLNVDMKAPLEFDERDNRVYVHGGGWGLGDFMDTAQRLNHQGIYFDITIKEPGDIQQFSDKNRFFYLDSAWNAWDKDREGNFTFAPVVQLFQDGTCSRLDNGDYPVAYDYIKNSRAIISKPGGGTLIDSFSSATPLVYLEPYGEYEKKNGDLWHELGYGMPFEEWEKTGFSMDILRRMHIKLMRDAKSTPDFTKYIVSE